MAEKSGGEGLIGKIFVGVATTVLATVIITKLGVKDPKPESPPKGPESVEPLKPGNQSKGGDKTTPQSREAAVATEPTKSSDAPRLSTFAAQAALPNNTCPAVQGQFWMQYPNVWYGPFFGDGISLSGAGGFWVYNAQMLNTSGTFGAYLPYPDPNHQYPRNIWFPLQQSRFSVCVDSSGNVFGWAQP